jgi:heme A synthase
MTAETQPKKTPNVQLQGIIGIGAGILVLVIILGLLRLRRDGIAVDPAELQMSATTPCMVQAIDAATSKGKAITYSQLDTLKSQCGE